MPHKNVQSANVTTRKVVSLHFCRIREREKCKNVKLRAANETMTRNVAAERFFNYLLSITFRRWTVTVIFSSMHDGVF